MSNVIIEAYNTVYGFKQFDNTVNAKYREIHAQHYAVASEKYPVGSTVSVNVCDNYGDLHSVDLIVEKQYLAFRLTANDFFKIKDEKQLKIKRKSKSYPEGVFITRADVMTAVESQLQLQSNFEKEFAQYKVDFLESASRDSKVQEVLQLEENFAKMSCVEQKQFLIDNFDLNGVELPETEVDFLKGWGKETGSYGLGKQWKTYCRYSVDLIKRKVTVECGGSDD